MNPIDQLKTVLCCPDGKCCINGSNEDRAIIDRALQGLAEPARTSQDVCTVPLLSDAEILQLTPLWFKKYTDGVLLGHARAIEQLVRRRAGL